MDRTDGLTRRAAIKLLGAAALAAVPAAQAVAPAEASRSWCRTDPVVKIDGGVADVFLYSLQALHDTATGPAEIKISVPPKTRTEVLALDPGFGHHGYTISFEESRQLDFDEKGTKLIVEAYVPSSDGSLPLRVEFTPRSSDLNSASAEGTVNAWVTARSK